MRITLTGATGFVGTELCKQLAAEGRRLAAVGRNAERARRTVPDLQSAFEYDSDGRTPVDAVDGADAIVHLAGESVVGLWTAEKRRRIRDSRVLGTERLVQSIGAAARPPKVMVCASAVGYYGDRGEELLTEQSARGDGFLADVAEEWERAATAAEALGLRVVRLRIGIVLAAGGGALGSMLTPAKLGLGGPLGDGNQWWSWIDREDLIGLIRFALDNDEVSGPVNATAPEPVRQKDFAKTLGAVLHRPAFLPAPAFVLRAVLGGFSEELLSSKQVAPAAAQGAGYEFRRPQLEPALRAILDRN